MRSAEAILIELLRKRGICSPAELAEFLSDKPKKTYDPFLLLHMEAGVDLLLSEIKKETKICIYGDYDADGVTSVCILSHIISMLTDHVTYYIPSRFDEGYGLNEAAISKIHENGVGLLVTADCGSASYQEIEFAKKLGMKVIVTDHHSIGIQKPDCILINPKQEGCSYPYKELAGCGVAFKLAQALQQKAGLSKKAINDVLDLAAIGTIADVMPLTDENRTIVKYGLNKMNAKSRASLQYLVTEISIPWITSERVAYGIGPHINAAGRISHAKEAVKLFLATDHAVMKQQAQKLIAFNTERKKLQEDAYRLCMEQVTGEELFLVLHVPDMHPGIMGIACGKVREAVGRPVIIATSAGRGILKGSGRSIDTVDLYRLLKNHGQFFTHFGGHKGACGFSMQEENLDRLRVALEDEMKQMLAADPELFAAELDYDMELAAGEIDIDLAMELMKLEPTGQGNERPVFLIRQAVPQSVRFMGEGGIHLKFMLHPFGKNGAGVECVFFRRAQEIKDIVCSGDPVDLLGSVQLQEWNGRTKAGFVIKEILACK